MPNFTEKAIKQSFMKLLNERPLNKITVKDIVEDCGINRNSFYYHFQDMPSLIENIIIGELDRIIKEYPSIQSAEECFLVAAGFALGNKRAVLHIYESVNRDIFERYLWRICEYAVTTYINTLFGGRKIRSEDKDIVIRFIKCECFGSIIDWLSSGMKDNIETSIHRLCELRKGILEQIMDRCEST